MKNRKCIGLLGMTALVLFLLLAGCEDVSSSKPTAYTVTFSPGEGGGTPPESITFESGTTITLPGQGNMTAPEGDKIFWGWKMSNGSVRRENEEVNVGSTTFTAVWAGRLSATFDPGEGGGTPPDPIIADEYGLSFTIPSFPGQGDMTGPEGKKFNSWQMSSVYVKAGESYTISTDTTFRAYWQNYSRTITFNPGEGSGTPIRMYADDNGTITLPGPGDMIAPEGKVFNGWENRGVTHSAGSSYNVYYVTTTFTAQWANKKYAQEGIYVSLISFAGNADILRYNNSDDFVFLNTGRSALSSILDNSYRKATVSGTALFYAVHKGLANLTANEGEFSLDISSINLITFTDGLDNGSFGASNTDPIEGKSGVTGDAYATYVHDEIGRRKINGKPVTAYSVGIKTEDDDDETQFNTTLGNIASTPGNVSKITDFNDLEEKFNEIAGNLIFANNFSMTTTQNDPGTIVRMTFDVTGTGSADAAASSKYLEGTLAYADGIYTLTNIAYGSGITSDADSGATILGTVSGTDIRFLFRNITGYDPATDTVQQWTKTSAGSTTWQRNKEYSASESTSTSTVFIQLALDASISLSDSQIGQIRTAVNNFITTLYNRVTGGSN